MLIRSVHNFILLSCAILSCPSQAAKAKLEETLKAEEEEKKKTKKKSKKAESETSAPTYKNAAEMIKALTKKGQGQPKVSGQILTGSTTPCCPLQWTHLCQEPPSSVLCHMHRFIPHSIYPVQPLVSMPTCKQCVCSFTLMCSSPVS